MATDPFQKEVLELGRVTFLFYAFPNIIQIRVRLVWVFQIANAMVMKTIIS